MPLLAVAVDFSVLTSTAVDDAVVRAFDWTVVDVAV